MSDREIKHLITEIDQNGDGIVDIKEFLNMIENGTKRDIIRKVLAERSGIRQTFQIYDRDGNGVITRDEFARVVEDIYRHKYKTTVTRYQFDAMMKHADKNGDGEIDYEEFLKDFAYIPIPK